MQTIAIVGAGFCGTLAAVHLLREPPPGHTRVLLLNRSGTMARGVAYGTRSERHVLNVPAGRMGAFPDAEDDFLRYLRQRDPSVGATAFVPRHEYGAYLESLLDEARDRAPSHCQFESIVGEAKDIRLRADGMAVLHLADRAEPIAADRVVLALGNYLPANPQLRTAAADVFNSPRYIRDPWKPAALATLDARLPILLFGTGLTMLDVVSDLSRRYRNCQMIALSRRGLLPQSHRRSRSPLRFDEPGELALLESAPTCRVRTQLLREWVRRSEATGGDWRDVMTTIRPFTPRLWQSSSAGERARFLRHLKPFWEVHRHRCAPELADELQALRQSGQLQVCAGRLLRIDETSDALSVTYRARKGGTAKTIRVGGSINCTGPAQGLHNLDEPLLANLLESGLIQSDEHGLGLRVARNYALLDAQSRASERLFYIGPFLRAQFWEATAVPELREHVVLAVRGVRQSFT